MQGDAPGRVHLVEEGMVQEGEVEIFRTTADGGVDVTLSYGPGSHDVVAGRD